MESSDSDMDDNWRAQGNRNHQPSINVPLYHNSISPWNKEHDGITTLYKCDALNARCLYIFDTAYKLLQSDQYDIGGANSDVGGLWFYFTTSVAPNSIYLMNIFVCQRNPGIFSLAITDSNTISSTIYNDDKVRILSDELEWRNFSSTVLDEVHHVKTFCFSEEDRLSLTKMVLIVPILIKMNCRSTLNKDLVHKIKAENEFGEKLFENIKPDFAINSGDGKTFKVHKIVIAAHSPVLRGLIRENECKSLDLNMPNAEIEILLHFLYTGKVNNMLDQPLEVLLIMADKFKLWGLKELVKHAMKQSIRSDNALDMAVLAEKYDCKDVLENTFKYVAHHPEILNTEAFSLINNATVVKELLKYIHLKHSN